MILHSRPWITDRDIEAISCSLRGLMIGQGDLTAEFESRIADWVVGTGGVAVGSGTAAIYLALKTLGVKVGDEVLLPTYVCASVAEATVAMRAIPVVCDVGEDWVVTPESVASQLTPKTKAIIVPHMYGIYADVSGFKKYGLPIIEDCAQALGYCGHSPIQGDIAVFSFHPTKCFSVGEGGMAVTKNPNLLQKMRKLKDGSADAINERIFSPLSNIASALGLSQLERYHQSLDRRSEIAARYKEVFENFFPHALNQHALQNSMFFRFPIKLHGGLEKYAESFYKQGVIVRRGVDKLLHRMMGLSDDAFGTACELFHTTISLPIYPAILDEEINRVIVVVKEVIGKSCRTVTNNE